MDSVAVNVSVVYFETKVVGVADFGIAHIHFHNAESCGEVSETAGVRDVVNGFVSHEIGIAIIAYVGHSSFIIHEVDIEILIHDDEFPDRLVIADFRDVAIVQAIYFAECGDAFVTGVVGIQTSGGQYIKLSAGLFHILHLTVREVGLPCSYAGGGCGEGMEGAQQRNGHRCYQFSNHVGIVGFRDV